LLIRSDFTQAAPAVKDFICLFLPPLRTRNFHQSTVIRAVVKNYFQLFFTVNRTGFTKSAGGTIS
jgi:hypothetical protein